MPHRKLLFYVHTYDDHLAIQHATAVLDFRMLLGGLPLVFLLFAILLLIRYQRLLKQPAQPLVLGEQGHDAGKLSQVGDD